MSVELGIGGFSGLGKFGIGKRQDKIILFDKCIQNDFAAPAKKTSKDLLDAGGSLLF